MNKEKIDYEQLISDFLASPVLTENLEQLAKERIEIQYHTEILSANWHRFRDRYAHLFLGLLKRKSYVSLCTSKKLFSERSSVSDSVDIFLNLVCDPLLSEKKQGRAFRELLKKVLMKIWHIIEVDAYFVKSITFLDVDGLTIYLSKAKIGAYALVFPPSILKKKEEEATRTICHEISHTLQPEEMKIPEQKFACDLAEQLVKEIDMREAKNA
ncbi:hypothetical protein ES702_01991 [subsurface metagenome]